MTNIWNIRKTLSKSDNILGFCENTMTETHQALGNLGAFSSLSPGLAPKAKASTTGITENSPLNTLLPVHSFQSAAVMDRCVDCSRTSSLPTCVPSLGAQVQPVSAFPWVGGTRWCLWFAFRLGDLFPRHRCTSALSWMLFNSPVPCPPDPSAFLLQPSFHSYLVCAQSLF